MAGNFFKHKYREARHTTLSNSIKRLGSMSSVMEHNRTKNLLESPIKFDFRTQSNQSNWIERSKPTLKIDKNKATKKPRKLTKIMRNKWSGFIEFAWLLRFTVALLSLIHVEDANVEEVCKCRCDWLWRYLQGTL